MNNFGNIIGYSISATIFLVGIALLANNINLLPHSNGDGRLETLLFAGCIAITGIVAALHLYKKSKSTKFLLFGSIMLPTSLHSTVFTIRTYPNESVSNLSIALLIVTVIINTYLYYIAFKSREVI